jgi:hypothetical protein
VTEPAASAVRDDRRAFLRCRRRAFAACGGAVGALAVLALFFVAPNRLASLRLGDVALAWWVAGAAVVTGLIALGRGFRDSGPTGIVAGTSRASAVALAVVWGSPALWLGLPPLLLADGTRGLWAPAVAIGGAIVALLLLGTSWSRTGGLAGAASAMALARWPSARGCYAVLAAVETVVGGLFVWAQLAAAREIGAMVGWPLATIAGVAAVVVGALLLPDLLRLRLTALGGSVALAGLLVPLLVVTVGTTAAWPHVWSAVASRARVGFGEASRWTGGGGAVQGPSRTLTLRFADEQRVTFGDAAAIVIEPREGGRLVRDVLPGDDAVLHPGDQLTLPAGLRLRFEAGRRVPNAPDSGPDWVEPPSRAAGWVWLLAMGVTGVLGALGLPTATAPVGTGPVAPGRGARLAALFVAAGAGLAVLWSLYAAWLTPEVYVGGVSGAEVYALLAGVAESKASGFLLTWLALGSLAIGGAAAALGGLRGLAGGGRRGEETLRWSRRIGVALVGLAAALAAVVPAGAWTLVVAALGLAASALAPVAVLACWSERATARGAAAGAGAGFLAFALLALAGVLGPDGPREGWGGVALAVPAIGAVPIHLLVAWALRSRGIASARSPLPPGLDGLSAAPSVPAPAP